MENFKFYVNRGRRWGSNAIEVDVTVYGSGREQVAEARYRGFQDSPRRNGGTSYRDRAFIQGKVEVPINSQGKNKLEKRLAKQVLHDYEGRWQRSSRYKELRRVETGFAHLLRRPRKKRRRPIGSGFRTSNMWSSYSY